MLRAATAIALSLATLVGLVVVAFMWAVFIKGPDYVSGGLLLLMLVAIGGMWFAFSRRWHIAAWLVGAVPVALVAIFLATFKMRMF